MPRILILGVKGNLGQQLEKVFKENDPSTSLGECEVIGWDREEIDITDKELIIKKINDIKPAMIINAAAYNWVDKCEESEEQFVLAKKINGLAVGHLAQAAVANSALLMHYSSDYVFSGDKKYGYVEDDLPGPINKYGETKFLGEKELIKYSGLGLKWYIIRTSKLFGPPVKSIITKPSFFDTILKIAKEKSELKIVDEEVSCFTYTPDLALASSKLICENKGYGIYHLVNSGACTWYEAAKELFKLAKVNIKIVPITGEKFPRPAKRPKYSVLINTKLPLLRDYQEALKEYLKVI